MPVSEQFWGDDLVTLVGRRFAPDPPYIGPDS
jgi:hypothetical protein